MRVCVCVYPPHHRRRRVFAPRLWTLMATKKLSRTRCARATTLLRHHMRKSRDSQDCTRTQQNTGTIPLARSYECTGTIDGQTRKTATPYLHARTLRNFECQTRPIASLRRVWPNTGAQVVYFGGFLYTILQVLGLNATPAKFALHSTMFRCLFACRLASRSVRTLVASSQPFNVRLRWCWCWFARRDCFLPQTMCGFT